MLGMLTFVFRFSNSLDISSSLISNGNGSISLIYLSTIKLSMSCFFSPFLFHPSCQDNSFFSMKGSHQVHLEVTSKFKNMASSPFKANLVVFFTTTGLSLHCPPQPGARGKRRSRSKNGIALWGQPPGMQDKRNAWLFKAVEAHKAKAFPAVR